MVTEVFPGRFGSLSKISQFVVRAARRAGLDDEATYDVQLAVDEACSNIIEHGYGGEGKGKIQCTCSVCGSGLTIVLRDWGVPFDAAEAKEPDFGVALNSLQIRGAGLWLIRKSMDEVSYRTLPEGGNQLTLIKHK